MIIRRFGALELHLEVDPVNNRLLSVTLPPSPPAKLTQSDLCAALEALSLFALHSASTAERAFQKALQSIPPGHTCTYGQIAIELHTSPRAVGRWCAQNRLLLRVPCHRIVGKTTLGGFNAGLVWKQKLLAVESQPGVFPAFSDLSRRPF